MAISQEVIERARARVGLTLAKKYRLDRLLGIGGMAAVYSATHRNKKRVAIKILHPELGIDDSVKTRFLREGYAANTVDHPGAVAVFDDDVTEDGSAFLVMELLQGETLDARAERKGGTLPLSEVLALSDQLLDVLGAAHDKGLVHRDIKPDNLFLTTQGQLKVLDFGIARLRELSSPDQKETGVGSFMGTPAFMSPEQARGRWNEVDPRSDVWAVGATMYNLLSGRSVHDTESVGEQLVMAATVPAPPLISVLPEIQPIVAELVDTALAFDKTRRWPDVRAMQVALRRAFGVVDPGGDLSVPKTSLQALEVDRDAPTLAISDAFALGNESRPSGPVRESGGSIPSPLTSLTGSAPATPSRRGRTLAFAAIVAAFAILTIALWSRSRSTDAEPAIESAAAAEPPITASPIRATEAPPAATAAAELDAGATKAAAPATEAHVRAHAPRAPSAPRARPPSAPAKSPEAAPQNTARKDDPLSKRY